MSKKSTQHNLRATEIMESNTQQKELVLPTEAQIDLNDPRLYINRELSMLAFQYRVLEEAMDESHPLLERVKFLAIVGSNLDEFFMVRVGGLRMQVDEGVVEFSIDGLTPQQQLAEIRKVAVDLMRKSRIYWRETLLPKLNEAGIHILNYDELNERQTENVRQYFEEVIFPVLTPLAVDPSHPFPHISNLSLNLAVLIRDTKGDEQFARIKVPPSLPRLVPIKKSSGSLKKDGSIVKHHYFVWLEQVIAANLNMLFPGMEVLESYPFRVTRNADIEIQEIEMDDLLSTMEASVRERRFGTVTRLSVNGSMPARIRELLVKNLKMDSRDVYMIENPLGFNNLWSLLSVDRYDLKDTTYIPTTPSIMPPDRMDGSIFEAIRNQNILLHHPYDSFVPVIDFLRVAARDPNVLAIKTTLYRVGKNAPVVRALLEAQRDYGKQVAVLVELKARFDEESNIEWAKTLEREGVHVTYGLVGLKTHAKVAMVVRKEGEKIRRYVHLGTGNYNAVTAQIYEDLGMFTCDDDIGSDVTHVFNFLTGFSKMSAYKKLLVAPINLRARIEEMIQREIDIQKNGQQGHMIFKINSLLDKKIIQLLYQASQAGVKVDLFIRGMCSLRPGIPGVSENIKVTSILGRYLEHSRIYYFRNNGEEEIYLGSADLMPRNLNRRVEILFPIENPQMIAYLRDQVLSIYAMDNLKARIMQPDGSYIKKTIPQNDTPINVQTWFMHLKNPKFKLP